MCPTRLSNGKAGDVEQNRYTITYRAAEARQVMSWIEAGQSGHLVGLRGAGKSNFLRFFLLEDVRRHYLGRDHIDFVFVLIDFLALTKRTEWAVYELVLDRLLDQFFQLDVAEAGEMASLHQEVTCSRDPLAAQRAAERCVGILCQRPAQRVVLLFDEFDAVFRALDSSLFRSLRATRDAHKGQVSYIVAVTNELACLREDLDEVEHFFRLVNRNVCGLGPYSEADAQQMIRYLASQRPVGLGAGDIARLIQLSGGHAGLLKAILSLLWDTPYEGNLDELVLTLHDEQLVQAECRKVWDGLSKIEQTTLCTLASGAQIDPHTLRHLKRRGLVQEGRPDTPIFSPLFTSFVLQQSLTSAKDTVVRRSPSMVQIDRQRVETLTGLEFEVLCYLYERRGQVCTKDELIANVYRQQYDRMKGGVTDEALQTLISRLRDKIEPDRRRPRYVVTIRGEGYKFVEPNERQV